MFGYTTVKEHALEPILRPYYYCESSDIRLQSIKLKGNTNMKLSTIAVIAAGIVGAVAAAVCIHGKSDTDVEATETPTETTEEPTAETTVEA